MRIKNWGWGLVALWLCPGLAVAELTDAEIEIVLGIEDRAPAMAEELETWVNHNTGSWNGGGLRSFAAILAAELTELGFATETVPLEEAPYPGRGTLEYGPVVIGRHAAAADAPRFLVNGHYDTVFEPDAVFAKFAQEPNAPLASGPGIQDMKGGLVVMFEALRALKASGDLDKAHWTVLLNGDEEIGSLASRPLIEAEAARADLGFVFEGARAGGEMVRSRRGLGQFFFTVRGVASHAGGAHAEGRSAILELAQKVAVLEAMTDYNRGITVNVGTIHGGSKRNIVPELATAWVDVRYDAPELGQELLRELNALARRNFVEGTSTEVWGTLHRPPKLATPSVMRFLARHSDVLADLGIAAPEPRHAGGGTDGSLMAAVGLPTLDSLGVRGSHAHTDRETLVLSSLAERAVIAALLLRRLIADPLERRSAPLRPAGPAVE